MEKKICAMQNIACTTLNVYLLSIHLKPMSLSKINGSTDSHSKLMSWFLIEETLGSMARFKSSRMMQYRTLWLILLHLVTS